MVSLHKVGSINNGVFSGHWFRRLGATVSVVSVVSMAAALTATPADASPPSRTTAVAAVVPLSMAAQLVGFDQQMIQLVNQARAAAGAASLTEARGLTQLSLWWSSQEAGGVDNYVLAHNPNAWTMLTAAPYGASNRTTWGENVAWSSSTATTAAQIFTAYMNSPGHRANILSSNYHYIGMGTVGGAHGLFNTTEFTDAVQAGQAVTPPVANPAPPVARPAPPVARPAPPVVKRPAPPVRAKRPTPVRAWAGAQLRDGDFIRDASTNALYEMVGGAPVGFASWKPFGGRKTLKVVRHGVFLQLPRYPRNGTYVRSAGTRSVFVIAGGAPIFISTRFALPAGVRIVNIDPTAIARAGQRGIWSHLRYRPVDGTFVRTAADRAIYRIVGGAPVWVESFAPFGGPKPFVNIDPMAVAHGGLPGVWSHLNLVPTDNTYIQGSGATRVYRVIRGHAAPVRSWASVGGVKPFTVVSIGAIRRAGTGGRFSHLR